MKIYRESTGALPAYAWPGGYPFYYLDANNDVLCPACACEQASMNIRDSVAGILICDSIYALPRADAVLGERNVRWRCPWTPGGRGPEQGQTMGLHPVVKPP